MRKVGVIAWKELVATFTDRNLIVIMIVTPLLLSTIIALAFGGGGDPDSLSISAIPIAVVNEDEGLDFNTMLDGAVLDQTQLADSLFGLTLPDPASGNDSDGAAPFNAGAVIVSLLVPADEESGGVADELPSCTMPAHAGGGAEFDITLEELFSATELENPVAARAAVAAGEYAAAIIIPAGFTNSILPIEQMIAGAAGDDAAPASVEVYANAGNPIEASIVRSVVTGIVDQFGRLELAVLSLNDGLATALAGAAVDLAALDVEQVPALAAPLSEWQGFLADLAERSAWFAALNNVVERLANGESAAGLDTGVGGAIACLFAPDVGAVILRQQPLNVLQEQTRFERVMVQVGSAQAVFFALFTGAFGILSIYQERKQWTLQRMLVSPTSRTAVLSGFLAGNIVVVWVQIILLMIFMSGVSSIIIRTPTFIWGNQWLLLFLLTATISLCVSGLGVLIVGIARTPEQVQVFAPVINIFLGALGGAFGFGLPPALANLSLITWATDAFRMLAAGESTIWLNLGVLVLQGAIFFAIGVWLFRRRISM